MKKSIVWLSLAAGSLMLAGCGGGKEAEEAKPAAAKKKGEKEAVNPWAKDGAPGSEPDAAPAKKKKSKKGKDETPVNPWAKETPKPAAT